MASLNTLQDYYSRVASGGGGNPNNDFVSQALRDSDAANLRAEQILATRDAREAALAQKALADETRALTAEQRIALQKSQTDLNEQKKQAVEAAALRFKNITDLVGTNQFGDTGMVGKFFSNLNAQVEQVNATRAKELKVSMDPLEEYAYRAKQTTLFRDNLAALAEKDPSYKDLALRFDASPDNILLKDKPKKEGILMQGLNVIKDTVANVALGVPALGGAALAIGSAGLDVMGATDLANRAARAGVDIEQWSKTVSKQLLSADGLRRKEILANAQGFLGTMGVVLTDPLQVIDIIAGSVAVGGVGGVTAKALLAKGVGEVAALRTGSAVAGGVASANDALVAADKLGLTGTDRAAAIGLGSAIGGGVGAVFGGTAADAVAAKLLGAKTSGTRVGGTLAAAGKGAVEEGFQNPAGDNAAALIKNGSVPLTSLFDPKAAAMGLVADGTVAGVGKLGGRDDLVAPPKPADPNAPVTPSSLITPNIVTPVENALTAILQSRENGVGNSYAARLAGTINAGNPAVLETVIKAVKESPEVVSVLSGLTPEVRAATENAITARLNNQLIFQTVNKINAFAVETQKLYNDPKLADEVPAALSRILDGGSLIPLSIISEGPASWAARITDAITANKADERGRLEAGIAADTASGRLGQGPLITAPVAAPVAAPVTAPVAAPVTAGVGNFSPLDKALATSSINPLTAAQRAVAANTKFTTNADIPAATAAVGILPAVDPRAGGTAPKKVEAVSATASTSDAVATNPLPTAAGPVAAPLQPSIPKTTGVAEGPSTFASPIPEAARKELELPFAMRLPSTQIRDAIAAPGASGDGKLADVVRIMDAVRGRDADLDATADMGREMLARARELGAFPDVLIDATLEKQKLRGQYLAPEGIIRLNPNNVGLDMAVTLIHEYAHRLTAAAIINPQSEAEVNARDGLLKAMEAAKAAGIKHNNAFKDPAEFIAEAKSDITFARALANTPMTGEKRTIFQKIWDTIVDFFSGRDKKSIQDYVDHVSIPLYAGRTGLVTTAMPRPQVEAVANVIENAIDRANHTNTVMEIKRVVAAPGSLRLNAVKDALRPIATSIVDVVERGGMTQFMASRILDEGKGALLGGLSKPVLKLQEQLYGRQQELIAAGQKVTNAIRDLGATAETRLLNVAKALTTANGGRGFDPKSTPNTPEEAAALKDYEALSPKERAALYAAQAHLKYVHDNFWEKAIKAATESGARPDVLTLMEETSREQVNYYFPITRSGEFVVSVSNKNTGETKNLTMGNSYAEIKAIREALIQEYGSQDGMVVSQIRRSREYGDNSRTNPANMDLTERIVSEIRSISTLPDNTKDELAAAIRDVYAKRSAKDIAKYNIRRKGVEGGEVTLSGVNKYSQVMSYATASAEFGNQIQDALTAASNYVDSLNQADTTAAGGYLNVVRKHADLTLSPIRASEPMQKVLSASHFMAMAFTPAVAVWQAASLLTNSLPYLNSEGSKGKGLGARAAADMSAALVDTYKNKGWTTARNNGDGTQLTGRDAELFGLHNYMTEHGRLHDDALRGAMEDLTSNPILAKVKDWGGWFQNRSEYMVVSSTAIAAFETSKRIHPDFTQEQHYEWAKEAVNFTQPSGGQYDKPLYAKMSDPGKLAYMLRTYPIAVFNGMVSDMKDILTLKGEDRRIAVNRFIGQHSMMVMLGGITATPISYALIALTNMSLGDEEDPLKKKLSARDHLIAYIRENEGEDAARLARRGIIPGLDASGSLEISPLVMFRMPDELFSGKGLADIGSQLLGPLGSTITRGAQAGGSSDELRSWQAWAPRALQGMFEVMRQSNDGMRDLSKTGNFITEVDAIDASLRILGLQPRQVQEKREDIRLLANIEREAKKEMVVILNAAVMANDAGEPAAAREIIAQHNLVYKAYPAFQISAKQQATAIEKRTAALSDGASRFDRFNKDGGIVPSIIGFNE